jgi:hypothetical protein
VDAVKGVLALAPAVARPAAGAGAILTLGVFLVVAVVDGPAAIGGRATARVAAAPGVGLTAEVELVLGGAICPARLGRVLEADGVGEMTLLGRGLVVDTGATLGRGRAEGLAPDTGGRLVPVAVVVVGGRVRAVAASPVEPVTGGRVAEDVRLARALADGPVAVELLAEGIEGFEAGVEVVAAMLARADGTGGFRVVDSRSPADPGPEGRAEEVESLRDVVGGPVFLVGTNGTRAFTPVVAGFWVGVTLGVPARVSFVRQIRWETLTAEYSRLQDLLYSSGRRPRFGCSRC